jgi:hypothetical protein
MPLSQKEIRERAYQFANEWAAITRERAEAQTFWNEFFNIFGFNRRRIAGFEEPVKKLGDRRGSIDLFWKGTLLVEHKSKGQDLDKALQQAFDYFPGLKGQDLPKYVWSLTLRVSGFMIWKKLRSMNSRWPIFTIRTRCRNACSPHIMRWMLR